MFVPENEMGVIYLFAQICEKRGWEVISIGSKFPDAIIRRIGEDKTYRVEFEYMADSFIDHMHDIRKCDLIICWINNMREEIPFSIWELSRWDDDNIEEISDLEKETLYLVIENKALKRKVRQLESLLSIKNKKESDELEKDKFTEFLKNKKDQLLPAKIIVQNYGISRSTAFRWIRKIKNLENGKIAS